MKRIDVEGAVAVTGGSIVGILVSLSIFALAGCSFTSPTASAPAVQVAAGGMVAGHAVTVQAGACADGGFPYVHAAATPVPVVTQTVTVKRTQLAK